MTKLKSVMEKVKHLLYEVKAGDKLFIQSAEELIPVVALSAERNKQVKVRIVKSMLGYKAGDVMTIKSSSLIPR